MIEIKIASFIGHIIDIFGILMILYLTIKQSNNIFDIFEGFIFLICIIMSHIVKYIMYENLKKEEQYYENIK